MKKKVDWGKPVRYIGRPDVKVQVLEVWVNDNSACLAVRGGGPGSWAIHTADATGCGMFSNIPEKHEVWLNMTPRCIGIGYPTRAAADAAAFKDRVACLHIVYEDGEGLEEKS